jgi:2-(1,2-epoxy-1,2-dihydrophenyl)acetyl-CoA isomerase
MTASNAPVTLSVVDGVAHVELNRPDSANAIDLSMATALGEAVEAVAADDEALTVLVTGAGRRFCAGGDVASFAAADDPSSYIHELAAEADAATRALAGLDKPVVAAVQGAVAGAGLAVMLSCDLVVAEPGTSFVFAYPRIGLTPDCGLSWLLPRAVGQQRALRFALSGEAATADEALAMGLVTDVVPHAAERAREVAADWAAGPAGALGDVRRLLRAGWTTTRAEAAAEEARTIAARIAGDEARNLVRDFVRR